MKPICTYSSFRWYIAISLRALFVGLSAISVSAQHLQGFVSIPETILHKGKDSARIAAFEIHDHVTTNEEYARFIQSTAYPPPLHWEEGKVPKGLEQYPVIYVNREDADAYIEWLTKTTGHTYSLPTTAQFEVASRAGKKTGKYFWGNDETTLTNESINFDPTGERIYDQWRNYLKPARWGLKNNWGLYGMAGNVWQLAAQFPDPQTSSFKYRIEKSIDLERALVGGSWARSKEYLRCGSTVSQSPGIRAPDVGLRLVRYSSGTGKTVNRKVTAVPTREGAITVTWASISADATEARFNIYRLQSASRSSDGFKVNDHPISEGTSFVDRKALTEGKRYQYRVVQVDRTGKEVDQSEWVGVTLNSKNHGQVVTFSPIYRAPGFVPVFGDLNGDGALDCVIRLSNGNSETSQDTGNPVQLEAFTSYGRSLWRLDIAQHENIYGSASNCPFNVWDMDGDGRAEVITLLQIGDTNFVAILDGMSGKVKHKHPWPHMVSDFSRSSTRIQMSVGYLDGKNPAIITQTGIYENEVVSAFDAKLTPLWTFNSFGATNGSGGHKIEIADVDGDGKHEVVYGTTCLNWDGTMRWSIYRQHPDIISVQDYLPSNPGLEVFYLVESSIHAGAYLVDADSGKIIWKNNRDDDPRWSHGHAGWTADIWDGSPGMECVITREGHNDANFVVFSSEGKILQEPFPPGHLPIEWDGDETREIIWNHGRSIGNWNGKEVIAASGAAPNPIPTSTLIYSADLYGDFRDELVLLTKDENGKQSITVVTATEEQKKKYRTHSEDLHYRLWLARNMGGGYKSIYDPGFKKPKR
jgi:rhamnogalacturonan endolyase